MYVTCFLFLIIWVVYAWTWQDLTFTANEGEVSIEVKAPLLKQNCSARQVTCLDDCSFLCIEPNANCMDGVCEVVTTQKIPCNPDTGGMLMMVKEPLPHWECICSDSRFYGGPACDTLHPDVCEHGTFYYLGRRRYICLCSAPFELIRIDSKPHCVEKQLMGFYDESTMNQKVV